MASRTASGFATPDEEDLDLFRVMAALADPVRRRVVLALAQHDRLPCGAIDMQVSKSAATRHFRVLREAGLIRQWEDGNKLGNSLRREELDRRFPGLLDLVLRESGPSTTPHP
ncbi:MULTISPECIES: helix-turn-helix domain-containing protein [unclassified Streptomyces]|uniref:ArsR/SmtB family transcription factor n=1 Tax=unclassified Streptomyces TaxID=2593676 RepID=UPI002E78EC90|nr:helix-turn-helix domain-containing protein [Streptomyces sp. JV176]MEE1799381.1 helix-turn-helix domain-containing protein [Streptomyces sp. JV176]